MIKITLYILCILSLIFGGLALVLGVLDTSQTLLIAGGCFLSSALFLAFAGRVIDLLEQQLVVLKSLRGTTEPLASTKKSTLFNANTKLAGKRVGNESAKRFNEKYSGSTASKDRIEPTLERQSGDKNHG